jgi:hypothetical protein
VVVMVVVVVMMMMVRVAEGWIEHVCMRSWLFCWTRAAGPVVARNIIQKIFVLLAVKVAMKVCMFYRPPVTGIISSGFNTSNGCKYTGSAASVTGIAHMELAALSMV